MKTKITLIFLGCALLSSLAFNVWQHRQIVALDEIAERNIKLAEHARNEAMMQQHLATEAMARANAEMARALAASKK
jgi:quinol monooxygenase YgiN